MIVQAEAAAEQTAAAETAATETTASTETVVAPVRPEGLADSYWDETAGVKPEAFARLKELEEAEAARAADVPPDGKYVLTLPDDFKGLDGKPMAVDANDPLAKSFVAVATEHKLPAGAVNAMVAAYAQAHVEAAKADAANQQAEMAKLGAGAQTRIKAVEEGLTKHAGADAAVLIEGLTSAAAVAAYEKLLKAVTGPSVNNAPAQQPDTSKFEGLRGAARLEAIRAQA